MKTPHSLRKSFVILLVFSFVGLLSQPSFAVEAEKLYNQGMIAYQKGELVEALKYLFAYKIVVGDSLNNDPIGKNQLEAAIEFCENQLRSSALYAASAAASNRKIKVKGTLQENPYLSIDRNTLEKTLDARTLNSTNLE